MEADIHSREQAYLVRSLYFDDGDYQAYRDNLAGAWGRVKLRIRTYLPYPNDRLSVELKSKKGGLTIKHSTFISFAWYEHFMTDYRFPVNNNPVLIEFERQVLLNNLRPKVIVQYHRHGFRSRRSGDLRITFDHGVCSMWSKELFPANCFFRQHMPGNVVLEIKHTGRQPLWVRDLVQKQGLHWIANSKYAQSIERARPDVFYPALAQTGFASQRDSGKLISQHKFRMRGENL